MVAATHAQTPASDSQAFDLGTAAFQGGKYFKALAYFLSARDDGVRAPQLGYNLGVTYYHLGRYDEARSEFQGPDRYTFNRRLESLQSGPDSTAAV